MSADFHILLHGQWFVTLMKDHLMLHTADAIGTHQYRCGYQMGPRLVMLPLPAGTYDIPWLRPASSTDPGPVPDSTSEVVFTCDKGGPYTFVPARIHASIRVPMPKAVRRFRAASPTGTGFFRPNPYDVNPLQLTGVLALAYERQPGVLAQPPFGGILPNFTPNLILSAMAPGSSHHPSGIDFAIRALLDNTGKPVTIQPSEEANLSFQPGEGTPFGISDIELTLDEGAGATPRAGIDPIGCVACWVNGCCDC